MPCADCECELHGRCEFIGATADRSRYEDWFCYSRAKIDCSVYKLMKMGRRPWKGLKPEDMLDIDGYNDEKIYGG